MSDGIPYDEIDLEVRALVRAMNALPGIRTQWSCAGHDRPDDAPDYEGYVCFTADSLDALDRVVRAIDPRPAASMNGRGVAWSTAYVDVDLDAAGRLRFTLRFAGSPFHMQRQRLAAIERAIVRAAGGEG